MDKYWVEISGMRIDICWSVKVRGHLHEAEKEQQRISRNCLFLQVILILKEKRIFEQINNYLHHFQFQDFSLYCSS